MSACLHRTWQVGIPRRYGGRKESVGDSGAAVVIDFEAVGVSVAVELQRDVVGVFQHE